MRLRSNRAQALLPVLLLISVSLVAAQARRAGRKPPPKVTQTTTPQAGGQYPLETISVFGNHNNSPDQIITASGLKVGKLASKADFDSARDRLVATGAFHSVSCSYEPAKDGKGYDAKIEVSEIEQVFPLRFEDLPASDAQIRAWLKQQDPLFGPKIPATQPVLDRYAAWISEFLAQHNTPQPVVGKLTSDNPPDLIILFRPAAPRPSVARVIFTNTGEITAGTLQTAIFPVAVGSIYTEPQFRTLLDTTIRPLYEARGRIRVAFPKISTEKAADVSGLVLTVQVDQGAVYKLGKVDFRGGGIPRPQLDKLVKLQTDSPVNFDEVKAAQAGIEQSLRRNGYMQPAVDVKRDLHDANNTVDLAFQITPGRQFTFGKLAIVGLDITSEPVVRKLWGLVPGKPFNIEYPKHFLDRVREEGIFENLKDTRAENKIDNDNRTVDVTLYFK